MKLKDINTEKDFLEEFEGIKEMLGIKSSSDFHYLKTSKNGSYNFIKGHIKVNKFLLEEPRLVINQIGFPFFTKKKDLTLDEVMSIMSTFIHECVHELDLSGRTPGIDKKDKEIIALERIAFSNRNAYHAHYSQVYYEIRAMTLQEIIFQQYFVGQKKEDKEMIENFIVKHLNEKLENNSWFNGTIAEYEKRKNGEKVDLRVKNFEEVKKLYHKVTREYRDIPLDKTIWLLPTGRNDKNWNKSSNEEAERLKLMERYQKAPDRITQLSLCAAWNLKHEKEIKEKDENRISPTAYYKAYKEELKNYDLRLEKQAKKIKVPSLLEQNTLTEKELKDGRF